MKKKLVRLLNDHLTQEGLKPNSLWLPAGMVIVLILALVLG